MASRVTSTAGLTLATLLGAVCIAGAALYVSSAASAAAQDQLAHSCRSESALPLSVPLGVEPAEVARIGALIPHVDPPILTTSSAVRLQRNSPVPLTMTLLTRDGAAAQVHPALQPLGLDEVAVPREVAAGLGVKAGDHVVTTTSVGDPVTLVITQVFDDLPFRPEPDYWCGFAYLLRPTAAGDPGPPWGVVSQQTHEAFPERTTTWLEYRPTTQPITMRDAEAMQAGYMTALVAHDTTYPPQQVSSTLSSLLEHARGLATGVDRSVAPALAAGVLAALLTLLAAATFFAKEREQELRLLAVRGEPPWRTARRLLRSLTVPVVLGAVLGLLLAWAAVRWWGPTSVVDSRVLVRSIVVVAVATVVALVLVAAYAAVLGDRLVDVDRRRRRLGRLPFELLVVPVAVVSYQRLSRGGALQMIGVHPKGGGLLAQGFPLFGLLAVAAVLHRPLRWLWRSLRTIGSGLPRALRLGLRRVVLDPRAGAVLVVVLLVAAGCFTTARLLSSTAEQELGDKAQNYVGADLSVDVFGDVPLSALVGKATEVRRITGHVGDVRVEVMGVDRATFARVAQLPHSSASPPLDQLLAAITPTSPDDLPAIVVAGPSLTGAMKVTSSVGRPALAVHAVAHAAYFPGSSSGTVLVVDGATLDRVAPFGQHSIWFTAPPADVVQQLRAAGVRVGEVTRAATVFDTTNYRAQTWSYVPLGALSVLFVLIALGLQVLVVGARRSARQQAHVVMRRAGFRRSSLWCAAIVEVAVPAILGAVLGTCAGLVLAHVSVGKLDSLPAIAPPPRLRLTAEMFLVPGAAAVMMTLVVAAIVVRSTLHADPMRAIRGLDAA